ncbi:hypothetical protein FRC07_011441, partial [Ceratobasidium sp. 392]
LASCPLLQARLFASSSRLQETLEDVQWTPQSGSANDNDIPLPPKITDFVDQSEETKEVARGWTNMFLERGGVPRKEFEVGYSRSSGPGGQHVNKTSTKATNAIQPVFYIERTDSLQTSSDVHRSQSQNLAECLKKINLQIEGAAMEAIPKPPDLEKQRRIAKHEARFERANKEFKQRAKMVKQGRGKVRPE